MSPRRVLQVVGLVIFAVIAVIALWHGRSTIQERERGKAEAIDRCISAIRSDVGETFIAAGNTPDSSSQLAESAEFIDTKATTAPMGDEVRAMLHSAGYSVESAEVNWAVAGDLSIPGYAASGARYGPKNTFDCRAVVFKDGSVVVTEQRIN